MSDQFENDFDVTEAVTEAAADTLDEERQASVTEGDAPTTNADVAAVVEAIREGEVDEEEVDDDDFFAEDEAPAVPEVDPATIITIRTSQGSDVFVPVPQPMPLVDAIAKSGLRFNGDFTCWLNGQEVGLGTMVAGGQTVTVVGSVKGGQR